MKECDTTDYENKWRWFERIRLANSTAKILIQSLLLLAISILIALIDFQAIDFLSLDQPTKTKLYWLAITIAVYIASVVIYERYESHIRKLSDKKETIITDLRHELQASQEMFGREVALNECYSRALHSLKGLSEIIANNMDNQIKSYSLETPNGENLWSFDQMSHLICKEAYDALKTIYGTPDSIEVTYVYLKPGGQFLKMNAYANVNNDCPSIFNEERAVATKRKNKNKYCFEKILCRGGKQEPKIMPNQKKILKEFYFKNDEARNQCKYRQYIGVPVYKNANKPVGLLQVVAFADGVLGDLTNMTKLTMDVLVPIAYQSLIMNTSENIFSDVEGGAIGVNI